MSIGKNIKIARKNAGITQKELGRRLGVTQQTIAMFENNKTNIKSSTVERIANALGCDIYDIFPAYNEFKSDIDGRLVELNDMIESCSDVLEYEEKETINPRPELIEQLKSEIAHYEYMINLLHEGVGGVFLSSQSLEIYLSSTHFEKILKNYILLNDEGRKEACKRIAELAQIPQYSK